MVACHHLPWGVGQGAFKGPQQIEAGIAKVLFDLGVRRHCSELAQLRNGSDARRCQHLHRLRSQIGQVCRRSRLGRRFGQTGCFGLGCWTYRQGHRRGAHQMAQSLRIFPGVGIEQQVRLGARKRGAFARLRQQCPTLRSGLEVQLVVTDQSHRSAIKVQAVLAKHLAAGDGTGLAQLVQEKFHGGCGGGHG